MQGATIGNTASIALGATYSLDASLDINTAGEYRVAGTPVVGAQGAAVADATDAASAITQLNALLARLRAATGHGLIA